MVQHDAISMSLAGKSAVVISMSHESGLGILRLTLILVRQGHKAAWVGRRLEEEGMRITRSPRISEFQQADKQI